MKTKQKLGRAPCGDCNGHGFDLFNQEEGVGSTWVEVQRCDMCKRYDSDEEALAALRARLSNKTSLRKHVPMF